MANSAISEEEEFEFRDRAEKEAGRRRSPKVMTPTTGWTEPARPKGAPFASASDDPSQVGLMGATRSVDEGMTKVGGAVTDFASSKGASPGVAGVAGTLTKMLPDLATLPLSSIGGAAKAASNTTLQNMAKWWMAKALAPTPTQWKTGEAAKAIDTMLEKGFSPTKAGVEKMHASVDDLNEKIANVLKDSTATIDKNAVLGPLMERLEKFKENVTPSANINILKKAWKEFTEHPYFQEVAKEGDRLAAEAAGRGTSKAQALQEAGKFKTFSAQQENLAHGGGIRLAEKQPVNEPYMNVGATGEKTLSPSAYPVPGQPRVAGKYTENIQRVPEGKSAEADALKIYEQRKTEEKVALSELAKFPGKDKIPIQKAQAMKTGTYRELESAYSKLNMPDSSRQVRMDLARGLKEQIAKEAPAVDLFNKEESKILNALDVAELRMYKDMTKQVGGIAWDAASLKGFIAFMADRSTAFKALMAKTLYSSSKSSIPPSAKAAAGVSLYEIGKQQ